MTDSAGSNQPIPIELGRREELEHFANRNAAFFEVYPRLCDHINLIVARRFNPRGPADKLIYMLGRLAVEEDFNEILLVSGYGRGAAGLKLLRSMFETSVTMHYLARHPDEATLYLDYHFVHQRKLVTVAQSTGLDISDVVPLKDQTEIERAYQGVKDKYLRVACPDCGRRSVGPTWHEKDITAMAREAGLEKSMLGSYLIPTHQIHSTPVKLFRRVERTPDAILYNSEPRRAEADSAVAGAHLCVTEILVEHNRHFGLGHASLAQELEADLLRAWGKRPDLQIV